MVVPIIDIDVLVVLIIDVDVLIVSIIDVVVVLMWCTKVHTNFVLKIFSTTKD